MEPFRVIDIIPTVVDRILEMRDTPLWGSLRTEGYNRRYFSGLPPLLVEENDRGPVFGVELQLDMGERGHPGYWTLRIDTTSRSFFVNGDEAKARSDLEDLIRSQFETVPYHSDAEMLERLQLARTQSLHAGDTSLLVDELTARGIWTGYTKADLHKELRGNLEGWNKADIEDVWLGLKGFEEFCASNGFDPSVSIPTLDRPSWANPQTFVAADIDGCFVYRAGSELKVFEESEEREVRDWLAESGLSQNPKDWSPEDGTMFALRWKPEHEARSISFTFSTNRDAFQ